MRRLAWVLAACVAVANCAPAAPVNTVPAAPRFPEFVYPEPPPGTPATTVDRLVRGWRLLQANDVAAAEREFSAILKSAAAFAPAQAASGYVELARDRPGNALPHFDAALPADRAYRAGARRPRPRAARQRPRRRRARRASRRRSAADASLPDLAGRVETLRVRVAAGPRGPGRTRRGRRTLGRSARGVSRGHPGVARARRSCTATWRGWSRRRAAPTWRWPKRAPPSRSTPTTRRLIVLVGDILAERLDDRRRRGGLSPRGGARSLAGHRRRHHPRARARPRRRAADAVPRHRRASPGGAGRHRRPARRAAGAGADARAAATDGRHRRARPLGRPVDSDASRGPARWRCSPTTPSSRRRPCGAAISPTR